MVGAGPQRRAPRAIAIASEGSEQPLCQWTILPAAAPSIQSAYRSHLIAVFPCHSSAPFLLVASLAAGWPQRRGGAQKPWRARARGRLILRQRLLSRHNWRYLDSFERLAPIDLRGRVVRLLSRQHQSWTISPFTIRVPAVHPQSRRPRPWLQAQPRSTS